MYHSYISSISLPLKGLKAEGQLRLASREIQYLVTEIPGKAVGRGEKKPSRKFRRAVECFQAIWFKSAHFFNFSKIRKQKLGSHLSVSGPQLLMQDKLQPQGHMLPSKIPAGLFLPWETIISNVGWESCDLDGVHITIPDFHMH